MYKRRDVMTQVSSLGGSSRSHAQAACWTEFLCVQWGMDGSDRVQSLSCSRYCDCRRSPSIEIWFRINRRWQRVLVTAIGPAANLFILPVMHYQIPMLVIGSILFFHVNSGSVIDDGCCVGPTTSSFFNFHFSPTHSTDRSGGVDAHPLERGDERVEWRAIP